MSKGKRAQKDGFLNQASFIEVKRRAKLICDALDAENDEKVEIISVESIKTLTPEELVVLGSLIENHGFFAVGEAITASDLGFFGGDQGA